MVYADKGGHSKEEASPSNTPNVDFGGFNQQQLLNMADRIFRNPTEPGSLHPTTVTSSSTAAENVLQLWEVLQILHGGRPSEDQPEAREIYDRVIAQHRTSEGSSNVDEAIAYVNRVLLDSLRNLSNLMRDGNTDVDRNDAHLLSLVSNLLRSATQRGDQAQFFEEFRSSDARALLVGLRRLLSGQEAEGTEEERGQAVQEGIPAVTSAVRPYAYESVQFFNIGDHGGVLTEGPLGELSSFFSDDASARAAANAFGVLFIAQADMPNDYGTADALRTLDAVTSSDVRSDPNFIALREALSNNDRSGALEILRGMAGSTGALGQLVNAASNVRFLRATNQAFVVGGVGLRVVVDAGEQVVSEWNRLVASHDRRALGAQFIDAIFTTSYRWMESSASEVVGVYDLNTGRTTETDRIPHVIEGQGVSLAVQLRTGIFTQRMATPLEIVIHLGASYRNIPDSPSVTMEGTTVEGPNSQTTISFPGHSGDLDVYGIEFRLPRPFYDRTDSESNRYFWIRFDGVMLAGRGTYVLNDRGEEEYVPQPFGQLGGSIGGTRGRLSWQLASRLEVGYVLRHFLLGGTADAEFTIRLNEMLQLILGADLQATHNFGTDVTTIRGAGRVGLILMPGLEVSTRHGFIGDVPGQNALPGDDAPFRYTATGDLVFYPQAMARFIRHRRGLDRRSEDASLNGVPVELTNVVGTAYLEVLEFARTHHGILSEGDQTTARNLSTALHTAIDTAVRDLGAQDRREAGLSGHRYNSAMRALREGRISQALEYFSNIGSFMALEVPETTDAETPNGGDGNE